MSRASLGSLFRGYEASGDRRPSLLPGPGAVCFTNAQDREAYAAALAAVNTLSEALKLQRESPSGEYLERCKTSPISRGEVVMG